MLSYWESQLSHTVGDDNLPLCPYLMDDQFKLFVKLGFSAVNDHDINIWHLIRLFFTAELVKACVAVADGMLGQFVGAPETINSTWTFKKPDYDNHRHSSRPWAKNTRIQSLETLRFVLENPHSELYTSMGPEIINTILWVVKKLGCQDQNLRAQLRSSVCPAIVAKMVLTLVLPFLRKAVGFVHTAYALDICQEAPWLETAYQHAKDSDQSKTVLDRDHEPEIKRLLQLLRLPSLEALCIAPIKNPDKHLHTIGLMESWLNQLHCFRQRHSSFISVGSGYTMTIPIDMPTYFTLVDLPNNYTQVFNASMKVNCPNCKTAPRKRAMCLFCGRLLCCGSFCCQEDGIGECNLHKKICGGDVGMIIMVHLCFMNFFYQDTATVLPAPYLDQHGGVDVELEKGSQLFFNASNYNDLRKQILDHQIPNFITQKYDTDQTDLNWTDM